MVVLPHIQIFDIHQMKTVLLQNAKGGYQISRVIIYGLKIGSVNHDIFFMFVLSQVV